jgi:hypothetical protein
MTTFIGASVTNTLTTLQGDGKGFSPGDRHVAYDGKEYVYVLAAAAITGASYVCFIDSSYNATMLSTSNDARGNLIGIPLTAFASGEYGWLQVKGPSTVRVLASAAANARLNTTATGGALDDDGTVGSMQVQGVYLTTANGGATANVAAILNYPFIDVTL